MTKTLDNYFLHTPTESQSRLAHVFHDFLIASEDKKILVIKGYAGTGKTQSLDAIAKYLNANNISTRLWAPTGKAAKVIEKFTRRNAYTIHSQIYTFSIDKETHKYVSNNKENNAKNTVFIVDEASMVSDVGYGGGLLTHLINFVFSRNNTNNSLILVGDDAQLPPVGTTHSFSLDSDYILQSYDIMPFTVQLSNVTRQGKSSGILNNANIIRRLIQEDTIVNDIQLQLSSYKDIYSIEQQKLEDGLRYAYDKYGLDNVILLTKSNWEAVQYNLFIRHSLLYYENEIEGGDILLVTKNNYYYDLDRTQGNFIANGNLLSVKRVIDDEEKYGFRFATLELYFLDNMNDKLSFEAKVCLDTLHEVNKPGKPTIFQVITEKIEESYMDVTNPKERQRMIKEDAYYNALYVKYAYALTVHKAQGGQWETVFLDTAYTRQKSTDTLNLSYLRWLYTGFTRAQKELYLINFE